MVNLKSRKLKNLKKYAQVILNSPFPYTIIAILCFGAYGFWLSSLIVESYAHSKPSVVEKKDQIARDYPSVIVIPEYDITLPVEESQITGQNWEISQVGASHLVNSAIPGENNTIILYGHNKNSLFGSIKKIDLNKEIYLISKSGKIHKYRVVRTRTVNADDVSALSQISGETVVFYTCAGFADSKRFIVFAKPV